MAYMSQPWFFIFNFKQKNLYIVSCGAMWYLWHKQHIFFHQNHFAHSSLSTSSSVLKLNWKRPKADSYMPCKAMAHSTKYVICIVAWQDSPMAQIFQQHPLRLNTPKRITKMEQTKEWQKNKMFIPSIQTYPKTKEEMTNQKNILKIQENFKKNQTGVHKNGWWWNIWWWTQKLCNMFRGVLALARPRWSVMQGVALTPDRWYHAKNS